MAAANRSRKDTAPLGFVLLPPAFLGKWIWDDVIPHLAAPAMALDMPGDETPATRKAYTLDEGVADVARKIKDCSYEKVVLVGHSMGGQIASGVACRVPERIHNVVFISAPILEQGQRQLSVHPAMTRLIMRVLSLVQPSGGLPPAGILKKTFCNDLDEGMTKQVLEKAQPYPPRFVMDPVTWNVRRMTVPSLFVKLLKDQSAITPQTQDRMIALLPNTKVAALDTGHAPMLTQPKALAAVLNTALG